MLHTSDWHLGRSFYGRKQYEECALFLDWLTDVIRQNKVDALLVAGDIFDTTTPGTQIQTLYFTFLETIRQAGCRHIVIIAGNHDSPSLIASPQVPLKALNIHVVGEPLDPAAGLITLYSAIGDPELMVAAVPYLRDRDIRTVAAGESVSDKEHKLQEGIRSYYAAMGNAATQQQKSFSHQVPFVVMGHLFAAGGVSVEGDGLRDLYVGSLVHVPASIFPSFADYVALGHLHTAQTVGGQEHIRYSGSPMPMSFDEAVQQGGKAKSVMLVDFTEKTVFRQIPVPVFRRMERVTGYVEDIVSRLTALAAQSEVVWVEVIYTGHEIVSGLRETVEEAVKGSQVEVLRIRDARQYEQSMKQGDQQEMLDTLTPLEVFSRCLDANAVAPEERDGLIRSYKKVLHILEEQEDI